MLIIFVNITIIGTTVSLLKIVYECIKPSSNVSKNYKTGNIKYIHNFITILHDYCFLQLLLAVKTNIQ